MFSAYLCSYAKVYGHTRMFKSSLNNFAFQVEWNATEKDRLWNSALQDHDTELFVRLWNSPCILGHWDTLEQSP